MPRLSAPPGTFRIIGRKLVAQYRICNKYPGGSRRLSIPIGGLCVRYFRATNAPVDQKHAGPDTAWLCEAPSHILRNGAVVTQGGNR